MQSYSFNLRALKAAAVASSSEETRYYLKGVCLEPRGTDALFVATDGHRLICFKEAGEIGGFPQKIIIPAHIIAQIKVGARDVEARAELTVTEAGDLAIRYDGVSYGFTPIDGTFPDWRRVVPMKFTGEAGHFNPEYVLDFTKAARIATGKRDAAARMQQNGPSDPALAAFYLERDDLEGFGVLMPMRGPDIGETTRPAWIDVPTAPEVDEAAEAEAVAA